MLLVVSAKGRDDRLSAYILGPPSFRPTTLPVSKPIITFKHEQHTLQRYTDTRTWPNVLGTCHRRVHQHAKAHVLHLRYHACTAPTCLRTLVFRVRVSLLRSVIRYVQKLRLIDWKDHVSLARCTLTSQENAWKPAIYDNLYAPGIKADCCTLYINCYVRRANLLVVANKNTLCEFFTSRCNMLYKICLEFY